MSDQPAALNPETLGIEVYHGLVHCIVSNTELWSTVEVAEVKTETAGAIAALPDGPFCLEPLWQYMIAKGAPYDAAASTILLFASRAPRWGIEMVLPLELSAMSEDERARRVDELRNRGGTSGTHVGRAPTLPPEKRRKRAANAKPRSKVDGAATMGVRIALAASAVFAVFMRMNADDPAPRVAAALGPLCDVVEVHGRAAICTASRAALADGAKAHERAEMAGVSLGVQVLYINKLGEVLDLHGPR